MTIEEVSKLICEQSENLRSVIFDGENKTFQDQNLKTIAKLEKEYQNRNTGQEYNNSFSYSEGDIVSYNLKLYVSNIDNNTSVPGTNDDWIEINLNPLEKGSIEVKAYIFFNVNKDPGVIYTSLNILDLIQLDSNETEEWQIFFDSNANITNTNYQVMFTSWGDYPGHIKVFDKTTTSFKIRLTEDTIDYIRNTSEYFADIVITGGN
jgi:hypothetical protein